MRIGDYIPSAPKISQEVIAVLAATVIAAWIISQSPMLQKLVRNNSIPQSF